MPQLEVLKSLSMAQGCVMRILVDQVAPSDSVDKYQSEVVYDGHPNSDVYYVPPHWHKYHDEYFQVIEGRASVTLEGRTRIVNEGDEPFPIPRWHVHTMSGFKGERLVIVERTSPTGLYKGLFFYDLLDNGSRGFLHTLRVFYDGDTYMSLPGNFKFIDQIFMNVLGALAKLLLFSDRRPTEFIERPTQ